MTDREFFISLVILGARKGLEYSTMAKALGVKRGSIAGIVDRSRGERNKTPIRARGKKRVFLANAKTCSIEGCEDERRYANGLCKKHYSRLQRTGTTDKTPGGNKRPKARNPIYANVLALADKQDWSVSELARQTGLCRLTIYRMNTYDPKLETLRAIGAAFNVAYWRLLIPDEFKED